MHRPSCLLLLVWLNWKNVMRLLFFSFLFVVVTSWRRFAVLGDAVVGGVRDFKEAFRALKKAFGVTGSSSFFCSSWLAERGLIIRIQRRNRSQYTILSSISFNSRTISHLRRQPAFLIFNRSLTLFVLIFNFFYAIFLRRLENSHVIFPCYFEWSVTKIAVFLIFVAMKLCKNFGIWCFILKRFILPWWIFATQWVRFIFGDVQSNSLFFHSLALLLFLGLQTPHHHRHRWVIF